MHGQIGVESTVGQGSAFWVEFAEVEPPLLLSVEQPIDEASAQLASRPAVLKTLLCIEDNVSNLNLIEQIFARRADIKLMAAMQGRLGLELAREHRPDLILLDLHLPDMGGVEVLRFLNEMPETKRIPVVIVSADATEGQIKRLLDQGAQDYLTKPINVQELLRVVNTLLRDTEQES
jgi:CheY-like chemotaxis protein